MKKIIIIGWIIIMSYPILHVEQVVSQQGAPELPPPIIFPQGAPELKPPVLSPQISPEPRPPEKEKDSTGPIPSEVKQRPPEGRPLEKDITE